MDERGLTRAVGRDGRLIIDPGIDELRSAAVTIPVIASGGAGKLEHLYEAVNMGESSGSLSRFYLPLLGDIYT